MDENDAQYYNEQIKLFEQNSDDMIALLKQQLYVLKSSLGAVNNTVIDIEYNERLLKEGLEQVTACMKKLRSENSTTLNLVSAKWRSRGTF
jgi:hypothetical protein